MTQVRLFLSGVSSEFRSYRAALRRRFQRHNVTAQIQEDFKASGTETLDKLDVYIRDCDAVIHLVGDMTGAWATTATSQMLKSRYPDLGKRLPSLRDTLAVGMPQLSFTQWEAYLAIYHRKTLLIAVPAAGAPRDEGFVVDAAMRDAQQAHLDRLADLGRYPEITFSGPDDLVSEVAMSAVLDILAAGRSARPAPITLFTAVTALLVIDGTDTLAGVASEALRSGWTIQLAPWGAFGLAELIAGFATLSLRASSWPLGVAVSATGAALSAWVVLQSINQANGGALWIVHQVTMTVLFAAAALVFGGWALGRLAKRPKRPARTVGGPLQILAFVAFGILPAGLSVADAIFESARPYGILKLTAAAIMTIVSIAYLIRELVEVRGIRPSSNVL